MLKSRCSGRLSTEFFNCPQPRKEGRLRKDLYQTLRPPPPQKASLLDLFLLPTPANPPPGLPTALLRPIADPPERPLGHTLIKKLLLQPVKTKVLTQGKAKALASPMPMWLAKAKKAKKARKARKVKKVKTPNKGQKRQKGDHAGPFFEGGKGPAKGDST